MPPVIDTNKCIKCSKCIDICSEDVFFSSKERETPAVTYPEECWHCNACILDCPVEGAILLRIPLTMTVVYKEQFIYLPTGEYLGTDIDGETS